MDEEKQGPLTRVRDQIRRACERLNDARRVQQLAQEELVEAALELDKVIRREVGPW